MKKSNSKSYPFSRNFNDIFKDLSIDGFDFNGALKSPHTDELWIDFIANFSNKRMITRILLSETYLVSLSTQDLLEFVIKNLSTKLPEMSYFKDNKIFYQLNDTKLHVLTYGKKRL